MQLCLCKGNKFFWNDQMFGGIFCPINCKLQIANCKLVFLYVSVCITLKGCLRIVILLIYKVIIYYYNNIINNIIYILYIIYINTFGKQQRKYWICNLQFAICNFSWLDNWLQGSDNDGLFLLGSDTAICGISVEVKAESQRSNSGVT